MNDNEISTSITALTDATGALTRAVTCIAEEADLRPAELDAIRDELNDVRTALGRIERHRADRVPATLAEIEDDWVIDA